MKTEMLKQGNIKSSDDQMTDHGRRGQETGGRRTGDVGPLGAGYDELLTKQELAAKLKVSVRCVENWQRVGLLPYFKIASVALFFWPDVIAHFKAHLQFNPRDGERPDTEI